MLDFVALVSFIVIAILCTGLVLHQEYEDGLIGRLALSVFSLTAVSRLPDAFDAVLTGEPLHISAQGLAIWVALAVFFARHWYRFYVARKGRYFAGMGERRARGSGMEAQK